MWTLIEKHTNDVSAQFDDDFSVPEREGEGGKISLRPGQIDP